jgi:hypothetical protein
MKIVALVITISVLAPIANAEQGDAEDRLLIEQTREQVTTQEAPPAQTQPDAAYGGVKTTTQSGQPALNKNIGTKNGQ